MLRMASCLLVFCALASAAAAQVRINISIPKMEGIPKIDATIQNQSNQPITVCLDLGYRSTSGNVVETTPHPFDVQKQSQDSWSTLLNGTDIGGFHRPDLIQKGDSVDFPFQPKTPGHLRLVLHYWAGSVPSIDCEKAPKGARKVKSKAFDIRPYYTMH